MIVEDGLAIVLRRRQEEGFKVTKTKVNDWIKLIVDFSYREGDCWIMRYGSNELIDDVLRFLFTNPFIPLPIKTHINEDCL